MTISLTSPYGISTADILFQALSASIFHISHKHPLALSQLLIALQEDFLDGHVSIVHLYVFHKMHGFLEQAFDEESYAGVSAISNMLSSLVPLVKSNIIDEDLVHEGFKCAVKALEMLKDSRTTQFLGSNRATNLYKDFALSAKYFAIMLIQPQQYTNDKKAKLTSVLLSVRINMSYLCESIIDELTDVPMSALSPSNSTSGMPNST